MARLTHIIPTSMLGLSLFAASSAVSASDAHVTFFDVGNATCVLAQTPDTSIIVTDSPQDRSACYDIVKTQSGKLGPVTFINLSAKQTLSKEWRDSFELVQTVNQTTALSNDKLILEGDTRLLVLPMTKLADGGTGFVAKLTYAYLNILFISDNVSDNAAILDASCQTLERVYDPDTIYDLDTDLVLVPSSGRRNAISRCFLETITPHFAVFSAGSGEALPAADVATLYKSVGIADNNLLRTDRGDDEDGWRDHMTVAGCVDPKGDDTIKATLSTSGELTLGYVRPPAACEVSENG